MSASATNPVHNEQTPRERISAIFKAYDVRGLAPEQFDSEIAEAVGAAFARFCGCEKVVVARDMRTTGIALSRAFINGVLNEGVDVVDIGLASTDLMYFASGSMAVPGAMFTASHNPAQYNGIKMCLAGASPLAEDSGLREIAELAASLTETGAFNPSGKPKGVLTEQSLLEAFADHALSFIDASLIKDLRVVADTANGMGGLVAPAVLGRLPIELDVLFPELDGTFPNHPADPIQPENLRDLQGRVKANHADIGLAFDGDADRVFIVDELGNPISGSTTTAMVAASILAKNPGSTVLYNCICSKAVSEVVKERGGKAVRTRVGHSFIKQLMAETDAIFGGEHSAHYYFRNNWRADSGIIAALHVLELLCAAGPNAKLSELRKPFERYVGSGEINTKVASTAAVIQRIEAAYGPKAVSIDHLDGLTVDYGTWWFNLRASNTEPLLRLNLEASSDDECTQRTAEVITLIAGLANVKD
jgi:phosphomannomutase